MGAPAENLEKPKRIRVSEKALNTVFKAVRENGMAVDKLLIISGKVEVHVHPVEDRDVPANDGGLKDW